MIKDIVSNFLEQLPAEDEHYAVLFEKDDKRWVLRAKYDKKDVLIAAIYHDEYVMHVKLYDCRCGLPEEMKTVVRKAIFEIAKQFGRHYV